MFFFAGTEHSPHMLKQCRSYCCLLLSPYFPRAAAATNLSVTLTAHVAVGSSRQARSEAVA